MRFLRLLKIIFVVLRFGLDEFLLAHKKTSWLRRPLNWLLFFRNTSRPRAERLRLALVAEGVGELLLHHEPGGRDGGGGGHIGVVHDRGDVWNDKHVPAAGRAEAKRAGRRPRGGAHERGRRGAGGEGGPRLGQRGPRGRERGAAGSQAVEGRPRETDLSVENLCESFVVSRKVEVQAL